MSNKIFNQQNLYEGNSNIKTHHFLIIVGIIIVLLSALVALAFTSIVPEEKSVVEIIIPNGKTVSDVKKETSVNAVVPKTTEQEHKPISPHITAEAPSELLKPAEQGDPTAQYNLGIMYSEGIGVPKDYPKAIEWFKKAAAQKVDTDIQFLLGAMYAEGKGIPQNYPKAVEWFKKAAKQGRAPGSGSAPIYNHMGINAWKDPNAITFYTEQAAQGNHEAYYNLGALHEHGIGVPRDLEKAAEFFKKAAEQKGAPYMQFWLANIYVNGKGVPRDLTKAAEWFAKAAEQGNEVAQYRLGIMYATGRGVPQDYAKAAELLKKIAEQSYAITPNAQAALGLIYLQEDIQKACSLIHAAAVGYVAAERKDKTPIDAHTELCGQHIQ